MTNVIVTYFASDGEPRLATGGGRVMFCQWRTGARGRGWGCGLMVVPPTFMPFVLCKLDGNHLHQPSSALQYCTVCCLLLLFCFLRMKQWLQAMMQLNLIYLFAISM